MEKMKALISILMPAYNCEKFIKRSIKSILNQSYANFELLIADDCSTDSTRKQIASFSDKRIKTFHNDTNLGYLKTWNKLIQEAKGDFITFMDADDYSHPERLHLLLDTLEKNTSISICGSNYLKVDENDDVREVSSFPLEHQIIFNSMPQQYYFIGSALMIRREVFTQIGGYNEFFDRMGQEDHYWVYLCLEKFKMMNIDNPLYYYRFNPNSVSGNLANNPSKLNSGKILEYLIEQRKSTGFDSLSLGKEEELKNVLDALNKPFLEDTSYFFYFLAKRRFYEGHKVIGIKYLLEAIKRKPLRLRYYRDILFFVRN